MQLSTMVHRSESDDFHRRHFEHPNLQTRSHNTHSQPVSSLISNSYSSAGANRSMGYSQQRTPQSPPSPPGEEVNKLSLPSISSLLTIADGDKAVEHGKQAPKPPSPRGHLSHQNHGRHSFHQPTPSASSMESAEKYASGSLSLGAHKMTLPPTPPLRPDGFNDGNHSPTSVSAPSSISSSAPNFSLGLINNMDPTSQRQNLSLPPRRKPGPRPICPPGLSPYGANSSPYSASPYGNSPGNATVSSWGSASNYSPENVIYTSIPSAYGPNQQRPLPATYPPPVPPTLQVQHQPSIIHSTLPSPQASGSNPWQHHHFISPSASSSFPSSQDRYVCPTCAKAFSRPSSLRIHSHSHTGEKPYKCPHLGCGKAFSVRSNMKRHERGCHASGGVMVR
ncbi:hypothetical protein P152DRAFT_206566 [Eremomyces bilateralis CBS 781.70]|uniref:C2H2-type domain-containing protein n=1 Tax=Eremomyces bilateralis CBS 781.70 TaxID=1392243 RepID=A0A6G1FT31_9PEZI|nr:uncharacterized protein P152DRAFT_206566 [Eremomyces bilateralis CBS 781.70]KAF1808868.1 hypothetical protein P152DRAFT_206566 [Eremomyces bilateralis CBS 781.70]